MPPPPSLGAHDSSQRAEWDKRIRDMDGKGISPGGGIRDKRIVEGRWSVESDLGQGECRVGQ
jgi:hypothetical protein